MGRSKQEFEWWSAGVRQRLTAAGLIAIIGAGGLWLPQLTAARGLAHVPAPQSTDVAAQALVAPDLVFRDRAATDVAAQALVAPDLMFRDWAATDVAAQALVAPRLVFHDWAASDVAAQALVAPRLVLHDRAFPEVARGVALLPALQSENLPRRSVDVTTHPRSPDNPGQRRAVGAEPLPSPAPAPRRWFDRLMVDYPSQVSEALNMVFGVRLIPDRRRAGAAAASQSTHQPVLEPAQNGASPGDQSRRGRPKTLPRWLIFSGSDLNRGGNFSYVGGRAGISGPLENSGWMLGVTLGMGQYFYAAPHLPGQVNAGESRLVQLHGGYQWRWPNYGLLLAAGPIWEAHQLSQPDHHNETVGELWGASVIVDGWAQPHEHIFMSLNIDVTSIGPRMVIDGFAGYRVHIWREFHVGPHVSLFARKDDTRTRAGLRLFGLPLKAGWHSHVSAGVVKDGRGETGPYATITSWRKF